MNRYEIIKKISEQVALTFDHVSVTSSGGDKLQFAYAFFSPYFDTTPHFTIMNDADKETEKIQTNQGLKLLNESEFEEYFVKLFDLNGSNTVFPQMIVTNVFTFVTFTSTSENVHVGNIAQKCVQCSRLFSIYAKMRCELCECADPAIICMNCILKKEPKCSINSDHTLTQSNSEPNITFSLICDVCSVPFKYDDKFFSSKRYDCDICHECSLTEKGIELIKLHDMIETEYQPINVYAGFYGIFNWIPIYSNEQKTHYILACFNGNEVFNYAVAHIDHVNNVREFTIINNCKCSDDLQQKLEQVDYILSLLAETEYEQSKAEYLNLVSEIKADPNKINEQILHTNRISRKQTD